MESSAAAEDEHVDPAWKRAESGNNAIVSLSHLSSYCRRVMRTIKYADMRVQHLRGRMAKANARRRHELSQQLDAAVAALGAEESKFDDVGAMLRRGMHGQFIVNDATSLSAEQESTLDAEAIRVMRNHENAGTRLTMSVYTIDEHFLDFVIASVQSNAPAIARALEHTNLFRHHSGIYTNTHVSYTGAESLMLLYLHNDANTQKKHNPADGRVGFSLSPDFRREFPSECGLYRDVITGRQMIWALATASSDATPLDMVLDTQVKTLAQLFCKREERKNAISLDDARRIAEDTRALRGLVQTTKKGL